MHSCVLRCRHARAAGSGRLQAGRECDALSLDPRAESGQPPAALAPAAPHSRCCLGGPFLVSCFTKSPSSMNCHATGFHHQQVSIRWRNPGTVSRLGITQVGLAYHPNNKKKKPPPPPPQSFFQRAGLGPALSMLIAGIQRSRSRVHTVYLRVVCAQWNARASGSAEGAFGLQLAFSRRCDATYWPLLIGGERSGSE